MNWNKIKHDIAELHDQLITIRHDLHRHPELGFEEERTQGVVREWLEGLGYQPRTSAASVPGPTFPVL